MACADPTIGSRDKSTGLCSRLVDSIHNAGTSNNGVLYLRRGDQQAGAAQRKTGATKSVILPEAGIAAVALNHNERELVVVGLEGNLQRLDAHSLGDRRPTDSTSTNSTATSTPFYLASPIAHSSNGLIWASLNQEREVVIRSSCSDVALATTPRPNCPRPKAVSGCETISPLRPGL